ncbi:MAG: 5-formyltetrahydrofolate cyclo-ligase [Candidatus Sumerlaeaceae bacterium]|nr:5-formyltetrahydrofolate cyclo-ligase [Candidatus Sumerlaeaceae bacterium]
MDAKQVLRERIRAARRRLALAPWGAWNDALTQRVLGLAPVQGARTVFGYVSRGREPDTASILQRLSAGGATLVLPTAAHAGAAYDRFIVARRIVTGTRLAPATPATALTFADSGILNEVDLFLVPGLMFDEEGYRVGQGGGYFDRVLARARPGSLAVGLAFEFQLVPRVPRDLWDVPVARIVTEERVLRTDQGRAESS